MRKSIKYSLFALCALALASCQDVLDTHPTSSFDDEAVWGSKATADAFINSTYSSVLGIWAGSSASIGWEARTPNTVRCSQVGEGIDALAMENIANSNDFGANRSGILRSCNLIIEKVEASTALSADEKTALKAEGYFLRGMVFFDQARKMGRFLPIRKVFTQDSEEEAKIPMTRDLKESWSIVTADLQEAVKGLPASAAAGRATKYAAQVILSRAALQAYAYTADAAYLDMAITAAKDAIEKSGVSLTSNYGSLFQNSGATDREILLARYWLKTNTSCSNFEEIQRTAPNISADDQKTSKSPNLFKNAKAAKTFEAWGIYWPTQDLVDHYLVIDQTTGEALPWWETSQFKDNVEVLDAASVTTDESSIEEYWAAYLSEAEASLQRTPELLAVLKEAGVVDSGGAGLYYIIEGMLAASKGEDVRAMDISEIDISFRAPCFEGETLAFYKKENGGALDLRAARGDETVLLVRIA